MVLLTHDVNNTTRYHAGMTIKSFKCKDTEALFNLKRVARFSKLERPALRKLKQLDTGTGDR